MASRVRASRDIDEAIAWYLGENAAYAASGFIDAVERAFGHISRFPSAGSPRYALELNLPELRSWPVPGYPWLVFYVEREDHIDIWRVLHSQRDIPVWMDVPGQD